jgi:hypothetical protein
MLFSNIAELEYHSYVTRRTRHLKTTNNQLFLFVSHAESLGVEQKVSDYMYISNDVFQGIPT